MAETRICKNCGKDFHISDENLKFYEKVSPVFEGKKYIISPPTFCPDCRQQKRWAIRNQDTLYKRTCDFSGEKMISLYSPDKPFKVYKEDIWWSDKWDPLSYGKDFDFTRPFFEQFSELLHAVPRRGMHNDGTNENSEYTTFGFSNRNCYHTFASFHSENLYYGTLCGIMRDSCDCFFCTESELIYECTDCKNCYNIDFCRQLIRTKIRSRRCTFRSTILTFYVESQNRKCAD